MLQKRMSGRTALKARVGGDGIGVCVLLDVAIVENLRATIAMIAPAKLTGQTLQDRIAP